MQAQYKNLLIHTLALCGGTPTLDVLRGVLKRAVALGATGIEFLFRPMPVLPAKDVARLYREEGCKGAGLCVFNPGGEFGHPLIPHLRAPAVDLVTEAIQYAVELRDEGVNIRIIDGPLAFVLGEQTVPPRAIEQAAEFGNIVAEIAARANITLVLELLQKSEDGAIRYPRVLAAIVDTVDSPYFQAHPDTFHLVKNGGH